MLWKCLSDERPSQVSANLLTSQGIQNFTYFAREEENTKPGEKCIPSSKHENLPTGPFYRIESFFTKSHFSFEVVSRDVRKLVSQRKDCLPDIYGQPETDMEN